MFNECVVGVFQKRVDAEEAIHLLSRSDVPMERVSLVAPGTEEEANWEELGRGDDSLKDAALGAGIGGAVGLLTGAVVVTFAGVGATLLAGPLGVGMAGATIGALVAAMGGWGVHEKHARKYHKYLEEGRTLVVVDGDPHLVAEADRLLRETAATELHLHARESDDSPEVDDRQKVQRTSHPSGK